MITYRCDGCGLEMARNDLRYTVSIDVHAAYDQIEVKLADLVRDHRAEIMRLIERMRGQDPEKVEEQVYKQFQLDLCPACHGVYIQDPLRFRPPARRAAPDTSAEIDAFLRSLGYGQTPGDEPKDEV